MTNADLMPRHYLMRCIFTTGALGGFLFALLVAATGCSKPARETPSIKVGLGETIITPAENVQMSGFARSQVSTGIHDDLHVRSIVIEGADGTAVVMMSIAISGLSEEYDKRIRMGIREQTGIPDDNMIITVTHTHSGPNLGKAGDRYVEFLISQAVASAVDAWKSRVPARIGAGASVVMELGRNRRKLLYGGLHPDPEVGILKVEDANGKLLGVLFNYGCHPSALDWQNRLFSEDWPYYAIRGIKQGVGERVWVAFSQSVIGNINVGYSAELSAVGADMPIRTYEYVEHKGNQMAEAVLKALPGIATSGAQDIRIVSDTIMYPGRESLPFTLEQARQLAQAADKRLKTLEANPDFRETRILDDARKEAFSATQRLQTAGWFYTSGSWPKEIPMYQQAARIGDAVFVLVPGQIFAETGVLIKERSPIEKTFLLGLKTGNAAYMPTEKEFIEGDYEVDGCMYSPKAEQVCIDSCLELIGRVVK